MTRRELLPGHMLENPVWQGFGDAVDRFADGTLLPAIQNLGNAERIRELSPVLDDTSRVIEWDEAEDLDQQNLALAARELGFITGASNIASYTALQHIVASWGEATNEDSYTENWWRALNLFLGTTFVVRPLWTQNYKDFEYAAGGVTVINGGAWYISNHVELELDIDSAAQLREFERLFNDMAPAHLVLESMSYSIFGDRNPIERRIGIGMYIEIDV